MVVFWNFLESWLLKHWKLRNAYRQWRSNFSGREKKQNTKRKTESYVFSDFSNGISRGWEWKSTTGRFITGRFGLCTWFRFLLSVRKNLVTLFFHLEPQRKLTLQFSFGDCRSFYFHSLIKSTFLVSEGPLWLYDKQNNTWSRVDIGFLFSCLTRHLARSLRSIASYRVKHSKRNSISSVRMYYSLFIIY